MSKDSSVGKAEGGAEDKPRKPRKVTVDQKKSDNKALWDKPPVGQTSDDPKSMVELLGVLLSEEGAFAAMCEDTFGWHNDRMDSIKQPRVSPASVYDAVRYDSDLFRKPSGTRIIMTDISRLLEDAMLLCLAIERAQNDVLIPEDSNQIVNAFSDMMITRNPEGLGGFVAVSYHAQNVLRGICNTHKCNTKALDSVCTTQDAECTSLSVGVHQYLVELSASALDALRCRVGILFRAGVCSPIHTANSVDLLGSIVNDILVLNKDPSPVTIDVVESNRLLGLVAAALRIHNTVVSGTVLDMTNGTCTTIVQDYPVLTSNWMIKQ